MKIQITKIEPKYIDVSTHEGVDWLLEHYVIHFKIADNKDFISGTMVFGELTTTGGIIKEIKRRIIRNLNDDEEN